jgi:hypothetical protein
MGGPDDSRLDSDAAVEERLRSSRFSPDPAFVERLEARLFRRERRVPRPQLRPALAGGLTVAGLAAASVALSLAGAGPLAPNGDQGSRAKERCRYATVERRERVPRLVETGDGRTEIRFRDRTVERRVKRCR